MNGNGVDVASIMQRLTNAQDFDISLLDQLVAAAYDPVSPHRADANKALMQLQGVEGMWQKADAIMEKAQNPSARFFGLQILDDAIKTRCVPSLIVYQPSLLFVCNACWFLWRGLCGVLFHVASFYSWLT